MAKVIKEVAEATVEVLVPEVQTDLFPVDPLLTSVDQELEDAILANPGASKVFRAHNGSIVVGS